MLTAFTRHTPWGLADHYESLGQGLFHCTTPSHGGYFVPECMLHNIPKAQQEWAAKWSGSPQWYEEDCCWAAVAEVFPDRFPADALEVARHILATYGPQGGEA